MWVKEFDPPEAHSRGDRYCHGESGIPPCRRLSTTPWAVGGALDQVPKMRAAVVLARGNFNAAYPHLIQQLPALANMAALTGQSDEFGAISRDECSIPPYALPEPNGKFYCLCVLGKVQR